MRKARLISFWLSSLIFGVVVSLFGGEGVASSGKGVSGQGQGISSKDNGILFEAKYGSYLYIWTEPGVNEVGLMFRADLGVTFDIDRYFIRYVISLFGGDIAYYGQTWGGIPVNSSVTYSARSFEFRGGLIFSRGINYIAPIYGAIGIEMWNRALDNSVISNPNQPEKLMLAIGYTEKWKSVYGKLGIAPVKNVCNYYIYGDAYIKKPYKVSNRVDLFGVEVNPRGELSFGIEVGFGSRNHLKRGVNGEIGVFYEHNKFGQSPVVMGLYQPESISDLMGIKVGVKF